MLCVLIRIASLRRFKRVNTICHFQYKRKSPESILNLQPGDFFQGTQDKFETAMVNKPPVFEPLMVYCMCIKVFKIVRQLP